MVSVAEHVVMMMLALVRNYMAAHYQVGINALPALHMRIANKVAHARSHTLCRGSR